MSKLKFISKYVVKPTSPFHVSKYILFLTLAYDGYV